MKKLIVLFVVFSLVKGGIMFINVLTGNLFQELPFLIRIILFFATIWLVDYIILKKISPLFTKPSWIKFTLFLFGTYLTITFITAHLFIIYNWLLNIQVDTDASMSYTSFIIFLIPGLIIAGINSAIVVRRKDNR